MQDLKEEIKRCQFLKSVYLDFGAEYKEEEEAITKDLCAALVSLNGSEEDQIVALNKLKEWV